MTQRKKTFQIRKEVKKLARERIGTIPASRSILPKSRRNKPKHKKPAGDDEDPAG